MQSPTRIAALLCILFVGCGENHVETAPSQTEPMTTVSALTGVPYNQASRCWEEPQEFSRPHSGCDNAITYALDSNNTLWRFPNTCLPDGFTLTTPPNETMNSPGCSSGQDGN